MDKKQILNKKEVGDTKLVAKMLGVSQNYATQLLRRPNAKRHQEAVTALRHVVETREQITKKSTKHYF